MLEQDDALSTKPASEEDKDATGLKSGAGTSGMNGFADLTPNR